MIKTEWVLNSIPVPLADKGIGDRNECKRLDLKDDGNWLSSFLPMFPSNKLSAQSDHNAPTLTTILYGTLSSS